MQFAWQPRLWDGDACVIGLSAHAPGLADSAVPADVTRQKVVKLEDVSVTPGDATEAMDTS